MLMHSQKKGTVFTTASLFLTENPDLLSLPERAVTVDHKERYLDGLRWKLGIATNPCIQYRKGSRCVYCGFLYCHDPVSPQDAGRVVREVLEHIELRDINRLELYVSGSFFDDDEVTAESRVDILQAIGRTHIREILLESRPEFITEENLKSVSDAIDPRRITIGIGVETMNDRLREALGKNFTTSELIHSLRIVAEAGMGFQAYLLLKPPGIACEREAILDLVSSSDSVIDLGRSMGLSPLVLAVQPFFFARNSVVAQNASYSEAKPPWLYSVALSLKMLTFLKAARNPDLRIILGNENDNVDPILASSNYRSDGTICPCTEDFRLSLGEINTSQITMNETIRRILSSECDCKRLWEDLVGSGLR